MIKLIKLCFVCCLIFRATFVEADYQNYKEYIEELKELEERYRNVDKTIDLSGRTMREVVKRLHDILQTRAHSKIGTSQEQDSHPALLKVNDDYYELYFQGTESQPGNCLLKRRGEKPKAWLKNYEYNSELNTGKNYVEQNLMFCLEIARRSIRGGTKIDRETFYVLDPQESWEVPIYDDQKDQFKGLDIVGVIVIGLNLVNNRNECPTFSFFGCFDSKGRKNIADTFIKKAGLDDRTLGKLKLEFYNKQIDNRVIQSECEKYFKNDLSDLVNNSKVVDKLKSKGFIHCEPVEKLTPKVLDTTNFSKGTTAESVIGAIKSIEFSSLPFDSNDGVYKESIKKISEKLSPVYVLDGNAKDYFIKFWENNNLNKRKTFNLRGLENAQGFLYVTGKDDTTRWFYLNKSNGTMYLLSETPKS